MQSTVDEKQCAFESCYTVDFLPITCSECSLQFCDTHAFTDAHQCTATSNVESRTIPAAAPRIQCSFQNCKVSTPWYTESESTKCDQCGGIFCITHRHETSHACASDSNRAGPCKSKESAEKALSNLKASSTSRNLPNSSDPAKLAKRNAIEVMKMRRKAEPADPRDRNNSLKVEDRLFVTVSYNNIEKILWLRKDVSAGKALDLFAVKHSIVAMTLQLYKLPEEAQIRTDQTLASQVDDGARLLIKKVTA